MKAQLICIGGGGHFRSCLDVIRAEGRFEVAGIADRAENIGKDVLGVPIIAADTELSKLAESYKHFFITIGQIKSPARRMELFAELTALGVDIPTLISPLAHVSPYARLGRGSIVMHHALVNAAAEVGENCILNSKCLLEHDVKVGSHCHISTGALINGGSHVARESFIGSGAVLKEQVQVGKGCVVGAGVTVLKDLPEGATYIGKDLK
jgi:sugar O-acyltransferase (sialic acid O-acetyltransferase NeuD family)